MRSSPAIHPRPSSVVAARASPRTSGHSAMMDRAGRAAIPTGVSTFGEGYGETTFARIAAPLLGSIPSTSPSIVATPRARPQPRWLRQPHDDRRRGRHRAAGGADPRQDAAPRRHHPRRRIPTALEATTRRHPPPRMLPPAEVSIQRVSEAAFLGYPLPPGDDPGLEATAYFAPPSSGFRLRHGGRPGGGERAQRRVPAGSATPRSSSMTAAPRSTR